MTLPFIWILRGHCRIFFNCRSFVFAVLGIDLPHTSVSHTSSPFLFIFYFWDKILVTLPGLASNSNSFFTLPSSWDYMYKLPLLACRVNYPDFNIFVSHRRRPEKRGERLVGRTIRRQHLLIKFTILNACGSWHIKTITEVMF
jgi:hypothetical protein